MSILSAFVCLSFDERSQIFILQNIDSTTIGKLFALASLGKALDNFGGSAPDGFAWEGFAPGGDCPVKGFSWEGFAARKSLLRKGLPTEGFAPGRVYPGRVYPGRVRPRRNSQEGFAPEGFAPEAFTQEGFAPEGLARKGWHGKVGSERVCPIGFAL